MKILTPNKVVSTTDIGFAMIHRVIKGYHKSVLNPADILKLAKT